jgi:hypothetical protein
MMQWYSWQRICLTCIDRFYDARMTVQLIEEIKRSFDIQGSSAPSGSDGGPQNGALHIRKPFAKWQWSMG